MTTDIDFESDGAAERQAASGAQESLSRVSHMADMLTEAQRDVMQLEHDLESAESALNKLSRDAFPDLLREVALTEIVLEDKRGIKLVEDFNCGIGEERRAEAFAWLREKGFGGLIKNELTVEFAKGEDAVMTELRAVIAEFFIKRGEIGRGATHSETVHFQTLKSFINERNIAGEPVPADLFGVHPFTEVKVVYPKGMPGAVKFKRTYKKK